MGKRMSWEVIEKCFMTWRWWFLFVENCDGGGGGLATSGDGLLPLFVYILAGRGSDGEWLLS